MIRLFLLLAVLTSFPLSIPAQTASDKEVMTRRALVAPSNWDGSTLFEPVTSDRSGIDVRYDLDENHPLKRLYAFGWATGNVAIGDVDGDGKADLFFPGTTGEHRLFVQKDDFRFEDVTEAAQIVGEPGWGSCAVMADVEDDGDLDIYVVNYDSPNELYMNISQGGVVRFVELAEEYGLDISTGSLGASFIDYNNDGKLDLYLQTYHLEPVGGRPETVGVTREEGRVVVEEKWDNSYAGYLDDEGTPRWVESPLADRLYRNDGDGHFILDTAGGLGIGRTYTVSHTWWDLDRDLRPDLFLGNDWNGPDALLINRSGELYVDSSFQSLPQTPWFSRGATAADYDNDLRIDLLATGSYPRTHRGSLAYGEPFRQDVFKMNNSGGPMQVPRNTLFVNNGTSRFQEASRMAGLDRTGATWAVKSGDYDGDGRIDIFCCNGEARDWTSIATFELVGESLAGKTRWDILSPLEPRKEPNLAYRNLGDWRFEETSASWGLDHVGMSYAAGQGDLDGDGDLDLVVCPLGEEVLLYRNHSQAPRVVIELKGTQTNSHGIGAELLARVGGETRMRQLYPQGGFKNADEAAFFLPLEGSDLVELVTIRWPSSGAETTLADLEGGHRYTITEAFSIVPGVVRPSTGRPMFSGSGALEGLGHEEAVFNDYLVEPLLPPGFSRGGPPVAASDLNEDRLSEIAIGGSADVSPRMVARTPDLADFANALEASSRHEDAGMVFFDANNDGAVDLFIASGGIESGTESSRLRDRLYFNRGNVLELSENTIPPLEEVTGPAAAADFDRDGDVDLFLGASFRAGSYPNPGRSRLLRNDGRGSFSDVTEEFAATLSTAGAVRAAIWTDADNNGWLDLMIANAWGEVQLWKNENGTLTNRTASSGLSNLTGLWNGIAGRDLDNDGDIDYILTNEGLNTELSAPARLFRSDFLDIGRELLVEAVEQDGVLYPSLGWLDFAEVKPEILETVKSPSQFVDTVLPEFFGPEAFASAKAWTASTLESGLLLNEDGLFTFVSLPRIAQCSQGLGVVLTDVNYDGHCDAYFVQNRGSGTIRRPDPMNTGVSQLMLGTGRAEPLLRVAPAEESGLLVFGPARGLIATDLNLDSRADFVATINGADPAIFLNTFESEEHQPLKVPLDISGKHPAGARVTVEIPGFPTQTAEYYAGSGYLSQSPPELFFGAPRDPEGSATVTIRWADGTHTRRRIYFDKQ